MSNLVPLFIDKTNGSIVATNNGSSGGGTPLPSNVIGFTHTQLTASTMWTIVHNKNTRNVVYQIFTDTMDHVFPDQMHIDNENQITVFFGTPMVGLAHLILFTPV